MARKLKDYTSPQQAWAEETMRFLKSPEWKLVRRLTFTHFEKVCTNCGSTENIHLDHVISRVNDNKGTMWLDINNLQPLCEHCNSSIKGKMNTDYRSDEHKAKCKELAPLFERALTNKGFDTTWTLWGHKKKPQSEKQIRRSKLKSKIRNAIGNSHTITFDEVLNKIGAERGCQDFTYIKNYINYCFSDSRKEKSDRKRNNRLKIKLAKQKSVMLHELYKKRHELTHEQLIAGIEKIEILQV
jgi:5-methylcytosine-specific restriction endonuclease McrA